MIRVLLPAHLQTLARTSSEVQLDIEGDVTIRTAVNALEEKYPMLRGTIRDHNTSKRRPMIRFFGDGEDLSNQSIDTPLPDNVVNGKEPLMIVGAIAGG